MVIVRFQVQAKPDKSEQIAKALAAVVGPSRKLEGVISFDIGRDLTDQNTFIATEVFTDRSALERQETLPEVAAVLGMMEECLADDPEATIFEVASSEPWG